MGEEVLVYLFGIIIVLFCIVAITFSAIIIVRKTKYYKKQVERSLKMVPFLVTIPQNTGQDQSQGGRDQRDLNREFISAAENMYNTLYSIYKGGVKNALKNFLFRSRHIALEIVAKDREILFYFAVPYALVSVVEKAVTTHYPDAQIEEVEEHNIFSPDREMKGVKGGTFYGFKNYNYPIKTYQTIENEPLEAITNALSMLEKDEGAAIQILIRPANAKFMSGSKQLVQKIQRGPAKKTSAMDIASELVNPGVKENTPPEPYRITPQDEEVMKELGRKSTKFPFQTRIRVVVAAQDDNRADLIYNQIKSAFAQFSDLSLNGFKLKSAKDTNELVTNYIFRFFDEGLLGGERFFPNHRGYNLMLNTEELASIFHLPNILVKTPGIKWLASKSSNVPVNLPTIGAPFAKTNFRGKEELVRIQPEDKLRHVYIIGQTGTGKTNLMRNMIIEDIKNGEGVCYLDPHGDDAEGIISHIPKERAEDVIIFDASDVERPMGLNLFDARTTEEKDLVINEAISMLYKLYDPGHTGIMGPRFEHWFRNAALVLMGDPTGGTFIEVPRIFTDDKFLADKLKYVSDPVVRNFWINEMGQTSDFHKSEVLGWFVGKFGAFMTNTTMRNILGQVNTDLNFRDIMDNKKILIVKLSKGIIGEINTQLLGMIFISKIQMAAMARADTAQENRVPFYLYIDEFQNFATDNINQIFSEARKFKLSLTVANQFIGQLREDIRDSVFGNVGTIISFRVGSEDGEFIAKQFEPEYSTHDVINQENYHAIIKLIINGLPSRPFNIIGLPPEPVHNPEVGQAIKELSRLKYAKPRDIVDAQVNERMKTQVVTDGGSIPREGVG